VGHNEPVIERLGSRWAALWVMGAAFPWRTGCLALLCALTGIAPGVFTLAVGGIVTAVPGAARDGLGSPAGSALGLALGVAAVALLVGELLDVVLGLHTDALYRRLDEAVLARVMRICMTPAGIGHLEDPDQQQRVSLALRAARFGPGEFVSGTSAKWQARAGGIVATVLVALISLPAAVGLFLIWLVVGLHVTGARYRGDPYWSQPLKRALYLRDVGLEAPTAKEVRLFGLADWLVERYAIAWREVSEALWAARRIDSHRTVALAVVLMAAYVAVLLWAAQSTLSGQLSIGQLAVLIQATLAMSGLGSLAGDVWVENGAVPIPAVLALERELTSPARPRAAAPGRTAPLRRGIRFERVTFAYPHANQPVLDQLDLSIPAGHSLAVVGDNGAGKTTILKLLLSLYQPDTGRITVDGTPLDQLDLAQWRSRTGVIFQDFQRYELSALDNIGFGAVALLASADGEAVARRAAERAGALDLIDSLPRGMRTILSRRFPGGVDLSGGQWQRIALARALFAVEAGAELLMLDEPTAHLDVRAEVELFDRFLEITAGLTTILVSHRFSTVRRANHIVVLAGGRVEEEGSHDELLARAGHYARMFSAQAEAFRA
jgi:ATP-binding cassette subfamily B protein